VSVTHLGVQPGLSVNCGADTHFDADGIVLATDVSSLRRIVENSSGLGTDGWRKSVAELGTAAPFVVQRLWLNRQLDPNRPAFMGTGGRPPLDNVSVLNRYEREAKAWSRRSGGSVVELHSYAVKLRHPGLPGELRARLDELYPEAKGASVIGEKVLCHNDCPRFAPGDFADRPGVATPHGGVMLAGDGIRVDLPVALMERAATTGWSAANRLLARFGVVGHALQTVPTHGRLRFLSRLAGREGQPRR
jgi:isorenieratene synthase